MAARLSRQDAGRVENLLTKFPCRAEVWLSSLGYAVSVRKLLLGIAGQTRLAALAARSGGRLL